MDSVPLITDEDIRNINNNFDSIINEFTKQIVVQKDLAIAQYIIKKQQAELEKKDRIINLMVKQLAKLREKRRRRLFYKSTYKCMRNKI